MTFSKTLYVYYYSVYSENVFAMFKTFLKLKCLIKKKTLIVKSLSLKQKTEETK